MLLFFVILRGEVGCPRAFGDNPRTYRTPPSRLVHRPSGCKRGLQFREMLSSFYVAFVV